MSDQISNLLVNYLPQWGPFLIAASTFLSCLLLPVPSSILLIAAGAFVASDDLTLWSVTAGALAGYIAGDQSAFSLGRVAGGRIMRRAGRGARAAMRARALLERHGIWAVFLSRWLFSPLGPWVTLSAGAAGFPRLRFTMASLPGAALWIGIYLGLGVVFGSNLQAASELASSALGLVAALGLAGLLIWWMIQNARKAALKD
ncbi:MAG: VTT domain-containing protein [Paracoccus sp. (in: a-proteobacteria)]|nr:VTT domain-containing protein [Paracoccus sp. (in: a-proteobacteria)]